MLLYIAVDGDDIGQKVGRARLADDVEAVRRLSTAIDAGQEAWKSYALLSGGSVVEAGGDECLIEVPADKISDLPAIKHKYETTVGATCSVGVGMKVSEASKALLAAKLKGKNQILFYNEDVEQLIAKAKEQQKKTEEEKIGDEYLGKAAPAMNVGAGAGFGGVTPPSKPTVDAPTPTQGEHSEGQALQALIDDPDRPPAPEMTHAAADFEKQLHDEATRGEGEDADRAAQSINNVDAVKQQIARALQVIKVQQPVLEQVKQASPQLYQAIAGLTQSVIALAREISPMSKSEKKQSPVDSMAAAVKASGDPETAHDCKSGSCYVQAEALHHLLGGEQSGWEPHHVFEGSKGPHWFLKHSATGRVLDTHADAQPTPRPYHRGKRQDFISKEPSKQARATIAVVLSGKPLAKAETVYCTACKDPLDKDGHCKVKAHWEKLDKAGLPMPKAPAHHKVVLPVGSTEGNKVKVQHQDGGNSWVQVGAGQIQSQDPARHPISSRNPSGR